MITYRPSLLFLAVVLSFAGAACLSNDEVGGTETSLAVAPSLGAADSFALLAGTTVTNTGPSMIIGDVGVSPGTSIVGFPPGTITGSFHSADAPAAAAQASLTVAYNAAAGQPCGVTLTGMDLGGMTLMPNVYCFTSSALLTGTLTLDGMGDPNAVWVFQTGSTLTTASSSAVNLIGGARPGMVFWQVGSSATLGTGTHFAGNILAQASITGMVGSTIQGRALARTGEVRIDAMNGEAVSTMIIVPIPDAGVDLGLDASIADAAIPDASILDAARPDAARPDAGMPDAATSPDATMGGLSGGAVPSCSTVPGASGVGATGTLFALLALLGVATLRRRRTLLVLLGLVVASLLPRVASAQSFTLDQFRAPPTSLDGLQVSRPVDMGNMRPGANLYLEYAHNPLVYEAVAGDGATQQQSIVNHQLAVHANVALGLFDRLIIFVGGTGNLVMEGDSRPGSVAADGTRMGDVHLGARVRLLGTPRLGEDWYGALAVQANVSLPMARWISSDTHLSGDGGATVTPELLAEVGGRYFRVTFNLGARLRGPEPIDTLNIGPELLWGVGVGVPVIGKTLEVDVEAYGSTLFTDPGRRATTPFEAIGGLRWRDESGWTVGVGAGPGLARGYGSPDFRALATLGWAMPAPVQTVAMPPAEMPPPAPDSDHDGVIDARDVCPHVPGPASNNGCALYVRMMPNEAAPAEIVISEHIQFATDDASALSPTSEPYLDEVRATLQANPSIRRVSIEGHADERDTDEYNMDLSRRRAASVMHWLVEHGIAANRLEAHGFGEREPFVAGTTPAEEQVNRNVQFFILDPPASHPAR